MRRLVAAALLLASAVMLGGCGGSSGVNGPKIQPAAVYRLVDVTPLRPVAPGKPVKVSFRIEQPDGSILTAFKTGPGPHTGIHLIFVRDDLAYIIHQHPPISADGTLTKNIVFPAPGKYRMVVDVYPAGGAQTNFQLFDSVRVKGACKAKPLPPVTTATNAGGYHFTLHGAARLKAIQAALVTIDVTGPNGKPAQFTPWYGALAHAIFFRQGSLDYFHTHVCAPGVSGCTSVLGPTKVTGTSATPGKLKVGVLVPAPGTWRLFLQLQLGGKVVTAPFTLHVR